MSTCAATVRALSLLSMSKNDGSSMRKKKKSINHHLNFFSTLKSYAVEKTITIDDQSADDDCTDKNSNEDNSSSSGNNESKSSVLEHYESLVNSGEVSKDMGSGSGNVGSGGGGWISSLFRHGV